MSDFVTTLREQLVDAAAREQARRAPRIALPAPRVLVAGAVAAALLVFVVVAVAGGLRSEPVVTDRPPPPADERGGRELFGGSLEAGVRYRTREFVPTLSFVPDDTEWFLRAPVEPGFLGLERRNRTERRGSEIGAQEFLVFTYLPEVYDPAVPAVQPSRTVSPPDLHRWFMRHPDAVVSPREDVTVAGVPGERFDVRVTFETPAHPFRDCFDDRFLYRPPRRVPCTQFAPNLWLPDGSWLRVTVLGTEPDPLVVGMVAFPWGDPEAITGPAEDLLASLRIGIR